MSPARTLQNTKIDFGETRTDDTPYVGYIALYPLTRKATTQTTVATIGHFSCFALINCDCLVYSVSQSVTT